MKAMPATTMAAKGMSDQLLCALILLSLSLIMGLTMSLAFRVRMIFKKKDEIKQMLESREFKTVSSVQLNNAEWAPLFIICLLYLHLTGCGSRYAAYLSVFSCASFVVSKAILFRGKPAPMCASLRYVALLWLIVEVGQSAY